MQFDQIRIFIRCAELGSLAAAARAEGAPKSSLSRAINDLERELKVELFNRTPRGVTLTQDGRALLGPARQILEDVAAARSSVRGAREGPSGTIRFTAPYTFGVTFIAPLLPKFLRAHPSVDVQMELTSRNVDYLAEGFDVGVRIGAPPPDLVARRIMGNPIILAATPDYLARHGVPRQPGDLAEHRLLLIGSPRSAVTLRLWKAGSLATVTTTPKVLSSDPAIVLRCVRESVGIGQLPGIIARREMANAELIQVLPEWTAPEGDISIIYPAGRPLAPRVRLFVDFICAALAAENFS